MMRGKKCVRSVVAFFLFLLATGCTKDSTPTQQKITDNFKALVMGGKDIDPTHTWNTSVNMPIKVSVDIDAGTQYKVYFYLTNPAVNADAAYVGMAVLSSGESKTVYANVPIGTTQLYAVCRDGGSTAICKPVSGDEVSFIGKITSGQGTPTPTTGNNWSVPVVNMPNTSKYTSGTLISPEAVSADTPTDAELHLLIDNDYTGIVPVLNNHTNLSIYVTGTWTLTFDQRVTNGNVIVVGNGGKIVIPDLFKLTTAPQLPTATAGMIYVLPGGEITGDGTVEFTDGKGTYSYNAGTITCTNINLSSGSLYNSGTIGTSTGSKTILSGTPTVDGAPGNFYNYANAYFLKTTGNSLAVFNANTINVSGSFGLTSSSRMDDGSLITCGSIDFSGAGSSLLYMGNAAYLNCSGSANFNNFGIWGPSGNNFKANALLGFANCSSCRHTSGNPYTYLLDHVQLILPSTFSAYDTIGGWINGSAGNIESSRQTCYYSYEVSGTPQYSGMFYAFEFPDDESVKDFDYNDIVLFVSVPYDNGDGTYRTFVNIAAVGTEMSVSLYHNGTQLGEEVHRVMGIEKEKMINASSITTLPRYVGEISSTSPQMNTGSLPFTIQLSKSDGTLEQRFSQSSAGQAPLYFAVNADEQGKWRWCKEGTNIGLAFLEFSLWAANQKTATDWYKSTYASSSHIVPAW